MTRRGPLLAALAVLAPTTPAGAIPRFALRAGESCSMCHVDPMGGGLRNDYGRGVHSAVALPLRSAVLPEGARTHDGRVGDSLSLGSDVRLLYQHLHRGDAPAPRLDSFYVMEAALYAAADVWDRLTVYVAPAVYGSESVLFDAVGVVRLPWADAWVKAGRFTPPYGTRLPNHAVFVRKQLGLNVRARDAGVEVGAHPGPVTVAVAVLNGLGEGDGDWDDNRAKAVVGRLEARLHTRPVKLHAGVSAWHNLAGNAPADDPTGTESRVEDLRTGVFGGAAIGRLTWLGEADLWRHDDRSEPAAIDSFMSYQELAFLPVQGLELAGTYELRDPDVQVSGDAIHRVGAKLELYPWPFSELNVMYRYTVGDARQPLARIHEVVGMAHAFF